MNPSSQPTTAVYMPRTLAATAGPLSNEWSLPFGA
jgi:hypothetical protein